MLEAKVKHKNKYIIHIMKSPKKLFLEILMNEIRTKIKFVD